MRHHFLAMRILCGVVAISLAGCGLESKVSDPDDNSNNGGSNNGAQLISGTVPGEMEGNSFTMAYGVVGNLQTSFGSGSPVLALSTASIKCDTNFDTNKPPAGSTQALIILDNLDLGLHASLSGSLRKYNSIGSTGRATNNIDLEITAISDTMAEMQLWFDVDDGSDAYPGVFAAGVFAVKRCL